ncbi:MAG TPA: hypothetical protein ENH82_16700 [bacterium]|nr:hypothetical protein [bacterium]
MISNLSISIVKQGKECIFYGDIFMKKLDGECKTANEITFRKIDLYKQDDGKGMFSLPLDQAKKLAKDILDECGGGE